MTHPRVAVLAAVRTAMVGLPTDQPVLVACSGGPDSVALTAAAVRVGARLGMPVAAAIIDHGLQSDSEAVATRAAQLCADLGAAPVIVRRASVSGSGGLEAAARRTRYDALAAIASEHGASAVLLGHTQDDQAETVLLGLARGSGARTLAGMPARRGLYLRPLLDLPRAVVRDAFPDLPTWHDPHNSDQRFLRVRVRDHVLPMLTEQVGAGVVRALARSAAQCRAEVDAVDEWARRVLPECVTSTVAEVMIDAPALADYPEAVVTRVVRQSAEAAGSPPAALTATHLSALTALILRWHGQGTVALPGSVSASRISGRVVLRRK